MASEIAKAEVNDISSQVTSVQSSRSFPAEDVEENAITVEGREIDGKRSILWEKLVSVKRVLVRNDGIETIRLYHAWPGNNVFFFGGRLICGPDPRGLLLTVVAISLSSWIFAAYVVNNSSVTIICSVILIVIVLTNLGLASMTDPGIIPRNEWPLFGISNRRRVDVINGGEVRLKYCRICHIYRPPRSRHCAICDNCVEKFDHHCPWIGQCIGQGNYRFYLLFLITALAFFTYIFAFSSKRIHRGITQMGTGFIELLRNYPEALALASFSFAAACFLAGLTCYHIYLIAINQTAYENFHQKYERSRNPYDRGVLRNIMEVLLVPRPPSRVDFRAEVNRHESCFNSSS